MMKKTRFYYEYGTIILFALGLIACVIASYFLSRLIPAAFFEHTLSPIMHGCIVATAVGGAIVMRRHTEGIYARKMWQQALIAWAVIEVCMWLLEAFVGVPTIVRGVQTIDRMDFLIRDVLAIILLAYPMEVLCPKWLNWWRGILLVLPSIVIMLLDMVLHEDLRVLQIIYPLLIAWWLWGHIREYRAKVEENYSSLENSAMPWLRIYLCILTIIGLSYFYISFTYHPTRLFTQQWLVWLLLIYNTAQIVYRRKPWTETPQEDESTEEAASSFPEEYKTTFEAWMEQEKPYRNPDFRLQDLSQVLPMNRTYLSQFVKAEYNCNFYQLVTAYRIREAKRLMQAHPDMKLMDIAEQSGFSSSSTFARTFAKEEGCSAREWQQKAANG